MSTQQTEETTYNGWKNYPTWAVNLWLNNDQETYCAALDITQDVLSWRHPTSEYWTEEESHRFNVADRMKEWVRDDLAPDLEASFASDLLGYALDQVDWNEIAVSWIESARDN